MKYVAHGNSVNDLNTLSEIKIYGTPVQYSENESLVIYPNPAQDYFNISVEDQNIKPGSIRIIDHAGKVVFEDSYSQNFNKIELPDSLYSGLYIVELISGSLIINSQKLIIRK